MPSALTRDAHDPGRPAIRPRLPVLDNLRAIAIVMVVVLHAAMVYMAFSPEWWYVVDPDQALAWTMLVLVVDVPIMPALFLIAGYFALSSLARRGPGEFVRGKLVRLGIPWVFGVVVLAPLVTYLALFSRGVAPPYPEFWANEFWGPWFQQSVYWFLGVLLVLFLLLAWTWAASDRLRRTPVRVEPPRGRLFIGFVLLTAAGSAVLAPWFGPDDWRPLGWFLVIQPARLVSYGGYFALGIYAERRGWLVGDGYRPPMGPWNAAALVTGIAYLAFRMAGDPVTVAGRSLSALLFSAFCLAAVMAGIATFQRWGTGSGRAWRALAENSFGIYYVHPLVLFPLALALVGVAIPSIAKVVVLVGATVAISLAITALVLRRAPGLRRIF